MVPSELQKPKITEIKVRMDCNGCVQKIKRALYGINGIYDLYIDFPQQKLTIIGWADPEKIMKAIKKTKKIATICSHTDHTEPEANQPTEPPPAPAEPANPPSTEAPPAPVEAAPPEEPPPAPETTPSPAPNENDVTHPSERHSIGSDRPAPPSGPKDVGEVHVIHHHPPEYGYRYTYGRVAVPAPAPVYMAHSYSTYRPPAYVTEYAGAPAHRKPSAYAGEYSSRVDRYSEEYHTGSSSNNGNITAIFSDENPNACTVM